MNQTAATLCLYGNFRSCSELWGGTRRARPSVTEDEARLPQGCVLPTYLYNCQQNARATVIPVIMQGDLGSRIETEKMSLLTHGSVFIYYRKVRLKGPFSLFLLQTKVDILFCTQVKRNLLGL